MGNAEKHVIRDDEVMVSDACAVEKTPPILEDDSTRMTSGMPLDRRHCNVVRPDGPAPITMVRGAEGDDELFVVDGGGVTRRMMEALSARRCAQHSPSMHGPEP